MLPARQIVPADSGVDVPYHCVRSCGRPVIRQFIASEMPPHSATEFSGGHSDGMIRSLRNQEKEARSKVFYHVYSGRDARLQLRAVTGEFLHARSAATALMNGRSLPRAVTSRSGVAGIVTGNPVWTRYLPGQTAVMITEHTSETAAHDAEIATVSDLLTVIEKAGNELLLADAAHTASS